MRIPRSYHLVLDKIHENLICHSTSGYVPMWKQILWGQSQYYYQRKRVPSVHENELHRFRKRDKVNIYGPFSDSF